MDSVLATWGKGMHACAFLWDNWSVALSSLKGGIVSVAALSSNAVKSPIKEKMCLSAWMTAPGGSLLACFHRSIPLTHSPCMEDVNQTCSGEAMLKIPGVSTLAKSLIPCFDNPFILLRALK